MGAVGANNTDTNVYHISAEQRLFACQQPGVNLLHKELWVQSLDGTEIYFSRLV